MFKRQKSYLVALSALSLTLLPAASAFAQAPVVTSVSSPDAAQMLTAASAKSSTQDEATFTIMAKTASGAPAANEPITWYLGPMKPDAGMPPMSYIASNSSAAKAYIASASTMTNSQGQATITLLGQPTDSMVMIAFKVGNLGTYNPAVGKAAGAMSAWWTTSSTTPTAPVGEVMSITPLAVTVAPGASTTLNMSIKGTTGANAGASIQFFNVTKKLTLKTPATTTTNSSGQASVTFQAPTTTGVYPLKTVPSTTSGSRLDGGALTAVIVTPKSNVPSATSPVTGLPVLPLTAGGIAVAATGFIILRRSRKA